MLYLRNIIRVSILCWVMTACHNQPELEQFMPIMVNSDTNTNSTGRILIVSHYTMDGDYLKYTLQNHRSYAKKHGYDYWFRNGKIDGGKYLDPRGRNQVFELGLYWQKIEAVQQALALIDASGKPRYDWVMWIDADAFFTNFSIEIENIINELGEDRFLAISRDFPTSDCVNAGVWIMKNNSSAKQFLNSVSALYPAFKSHFWPEQQAMQDLIYGYITQNDIAHGTIPKWQRRSCEEDRVIEGVKVFPQRKLNAFYSRFSLKVEEAAWQPGDYIAHLAGEPDRLNLIKRLTACMRAKEQSLQGCEVNGTWSPEGK